MPKVIAILVGFKHKMEAVLGEIRKLIPGLPAESSRLPLPPLQKTPQKEKPLEEVKTLLPQQLEKELVAELTKVEVPTAAKTKIRKNSTTPKISSKPSP